MITLPCFGAVPGAQRCSAIDVFSHLTKMHKKPFQMFSFLVY